VQEADQAHRTTACPERELARVIAATISTAGDTHVHLCTAHALHLIEEMHLRTCEHHNCLQPTAERCRCEVKVSSADLNFDERRFWQIMSMRRGSKV
jgi:hypothetical protein